MTDAEFAAFFAEVCARLGLRAAGYRRTGGSVRKRLGRRLRELGLASLTEYRRRLDAQGDEWLWLDQCCRITISRFARDAAVYRALIERYLPEQASAARARGQRRVSLWSAGAASGEEAYGLAIAWQVELEPQFPELELDVLGTDADPTVLQRAARGIYPEGSLRELPRPLRAAFEPFGQEWRLLDRHRRGVRFERSDLRHECPPGPFDLVLCRNLAFTYFDEPTQRRLARAFAASLRPGGILAVGRGEQLPSESPDFIQREPGLYARDASGSGAPLTLCAAP
jgi:chemotaxis protein methyltransferase CheR